MNPIIARAIAALGVILSVVSIWTKFETNNFSGDPDYWDIPHHAVGLTILALAIVAGVGVSLAFALGSPILDRIWMLAGTTVGGLLLFLPIVVSAAGSARVLGAGAWLGVASLVAFVLAGALLPISPTSRLRQADD